MAVLDGAGDRRQAFCARDKFDEKLQFCRSGDQGWALHVVGESGAKDREATVADDFRPRAFVHEFAYGEFAAEAFCGRFCRRHHAVW